MKLFYSVRSCDVKKKRDECLPPYEGAYLICIKVCVRSVKNEKVKENSLKGLLPLESFSARET